MKLTEYEDFENVMQDLSKLGFMYEYKVSIELVIYREKVGAQIPHHEEYMMVPVIIEVMVSSKDDEDIMKAAFEKYQKGEYEQITYKGSERLDRKTTNFLKKPINHPGSFKDIKTFNELKKFLEKETTVNKEFPTEGEIIIKELNKI